MCSPGSIFRDTTPFSCECVHKMAGMNRAGPGFSARWTLLQDSTTVAGVHFCLRGTKGWDERGSMGLRPCYMDVRVVSGHNFKRNSSNHLECEKTLSGYPIILND